MTRRLTAVLLAGAIFAAPVAATAASELAEAAKERQWDQVQTMLSQPGVDLNGRSVDGSPALHWAIYSGRNDIAEQLLKAGAEVDHANLYELTPLILAINNNDFEAVRMLLDAGADATAFEQSGETLLMLAARFGDGRIAQALIDGGANVNYIEDKYDQNALMIAVREDNPSVVRALIENGAELNHRTPAGAEPITRAPGAGGGSHGEGIVRSGVPPEGQRLPGEGEMSALMYAARDGRPVAARLLIDAGADIELAEFNEMTPLLMALQNDNHDIAKMLIEAGADVTAEDWYGREPLWTAVESRNREASGNPVDNGVDRETAFEVITMILDRGGDPNGVVEHFPPRRGGHSFNLSWVDTTGQSAFFKAALTGDVEVMKLLVERGADPNLATYNGTTPLMAAAGVNWVKGQTWIHGAEAMLEAVKMAVGLGADVNATNQMGLTAVHGAAHRGSDDIIVYLVERGAKLDIKDEIGRDPHTWAEGVFLASDAAEPKPSTMALIEQLLEEGRGVSQSAETDIDSSDS
jgi:ankyrin repeat protein